MYSSIIEIGLTLGFLMVLRLFIFYKKSNTNTLLLALAIFCVCNSVMTSFLNENKLILHFPFLIRTGLFTGYLIGPFLFLYVRNSFYPGIIWKKTDWLFLLPALFYIIDMFPFFISSTEHKIAVFNYSLNDSSRYFSVKEGWIALSGFHFAFVYSWNFILEVLQIRMVIRNRKDKEGTTGSMNKPLFWFLVIITIFYLPLTLPGVFGILFHLKWFTFNYVSVSLSIVLIGTTLYLFFYPGILFGFGPRPAAEYMIGKVETENLSLLDRIEKEDSTLSLARGYMKRTDFLEIVAKLEKFITDKSPFLDQRYSIHDLAGEVGIPVYQLSPIINQYYKDNFSSWINKFRVDYFIKLWELKENRELTIDALARKSGFSNRITFINAFKKEKKATPTMFLKK